MLALRINLTNVNLPKPSFMALQNRGGFTHCGVHLASVANIKAQRCMGEELEYFG